VPGLETGPHDEVAQGSLAGPEAHGSVPGGAFDTGTIGKAAWVDRAGAALPHGEGGRLASVVVPEVPQTAGGQVVATGSALPS
jgi:hypothetical protein